MKLTDIDINHAELLATTIDSHFGVAVDVWQLEKEFNHGNSSASVYAFSIETKQYIAKIMKLDDPYANMACEFHAMKMASESGVGPRVYVTDERFGIVIMEYVASVSYSREFSLSDEYMTKLATLIRNVHHGEHMLPGNSIRRRIDYVRTLLSAELNDMACVRMALEHQEVLRESVFFDEDIRPCHTDIHPFNMLYDGSGLKLIDWGSAIQESLYFDLAMTVIFFYHDFPSHENSFLTSYFQRVPTEFELIKLRKMKIIVYVYCGLINLLNSIIQQVPIIDLSLSPELPDFNVFIKKVGEREIEIGSLSSQQMLSFIFFKLANTDFLLLELESTHLN